MGPVAQGSAPAGRGPGLSATAATPRPTGARSYGVLTRLDAVAKAFRHYLAAELDSARLLPCGQSWASIRLLPSLAEPEGDEGLSEVRFLTVAEVAALMRVSKMTVYRLAHGAS
jgi:hypothetical protein